MPNPPLQATAKSGPRLSGNSLRRMPDDARPYHVQVNVDQTPCQVRTGLDRGCVIEHRRHPYCCKDGLES